MEDIWEKLYIKAKNIYRPQYTSPFVYSHHVVSAIEAENGEIFTGFCIRSCSGVCNLCAERVAVLNMFVNTEQKIVRKILTMRDGLPGGIFNVPCGACREFLLQLSCENVKTEIIVDFPSRKTISVKELTPLWWGFDKLDAVN